MVALAVAVAFLVLVTGASSASAETSGSGKQVYVVYMGSSVHEEAEVTSSLNHEVLATVHSGSLDAARESIVYSYKHAFRGFSAKLTAEQAAALAGREDVVKVFKSEVRHLHTTRSWQFLGLPMSEMGGIPHSSRHHKVILGVFDTGIWPESESFNDYKMPPIPSRWKGGCMEGENFTRKMCNRKLIGAKYYLKGMEEQVGPMVSRREGGSDVRSARDTMGHGTHTASTAAGRLVKNMNLRGLASGRARGGAPRARIAVYKVCWSPGCFDADLLAAFDDAIKDGVDVISLSLGPDAPQNDYFMDAISIGSFHAFRRGISVVGSVGNNGPSDSSATNVAPWLLTVASTSIDRDFSSSIILGNGIHLEGESLAMEQMKAKAELVYGAEVGAASFTTQQSSSCTNGSLDARHVRGKVVVCRHPQDVEESKLGKSKVVQAAGGVGMILVDELDRAMGVSFVVAGAIVGNKGGQTILSYLNSTRNPTALITPPKTVVGVRPAPAVSVFSSRGPNTITPDVLKPDIAAPGLNILAAWSPMNMEIDYNIVSGTSMAAPHIAGVALLLKASNPTWSPAAIKSAMMTTAVSRDNENKVIKSMPSGKMANAFEIGGGQVHPRKAQNPGLVYDSDATDILKFLCGSGYDSSTLQLITGDKRSACPSSAPVPADLNYPAITLSRVSPAGTRSVMRSVTNVGLQNIVYHARVKAPIGVEVKVVPNRLAFTHYGQTLSFIVKFKVLKAEDDYVFGSLTWVDGGRHRKVTIPLVLNTVSED
ncbi:hypothetical protein GOP47_0019673 [Adiantum capillus-veneris]|uniref:Uncharacterized protein n=1 Tax=Adiantum capillus-veneris TaxID=13818 RepID=A0A9D4UBH3_ADICA|nr:hypothetical protein GOP47_0019673 [Adiantum capillus-veneris]